MASQAVLVKGATVATGDYTIDALKKLGGSVGVMVRKEDDRAARLRAAGIEVVLGDLLDLDSVRLAMEGDGAAYFVYPLVPGLIDATAYFPQAALEAGHRSQASPSSKPTRQGSMDSSPVTSRRHLLIASGGFAAALGFPEVALGKAAKSTNSARPQTFSQRI